MAFISSGFATTSTDPVEKAGNSIQRLTQQGVQIPSSVAAPVARVTQAGGLDNVGDTAKQEFWGAVQTLNSRIKPVEAAKRRYRWIFVIVLMLLLGLQLYHSSAVAVLAGLKLKPDPAPQQLVNSREQPRRDTPSERSGSEELSKPETTPASTEMQKTQPDKDDFASRQETYIQLADFLMRYPKLFSFLIPGPEKVSSPNGPPFNKLLIAQVQLDLTVSFIGKFLLPLLYGMFGAVAFILRRISDESQTDAIARDPRARYSLRVPIGGLSGLAAGWVLQSDTANTVVSLTPFALAFVAGYSAELVFSALDRIVATFSAAKPTPAENPINDGKLSGENRNDNDDKTKPGNGSQRQVANPEKTDDESRKVASGETAVVDLSGASSRALANQ